MIVASELQDSLSVLRNFSYGLLADNFSWSNWYAVHIQVKGCKRPVGHGHAAAVLSAMLSEQDGVIVLTDQQSCLAIFNGGAAFQHFGLEESLRSELSSALDDIEIRVLSVCNEPHEILMMLSHLIDSHVPQTLPRDIPVNYFSQEIERYDDLMRLWETTSAGGVQRQKPMILVVDDDPLTRGIISHAMKSKHQLISAETAAEAVRKHILFAPNIIFLDINLPDHDGFDLLKHLRTFDARSQVVMFSSNSFVANRLKAFACGASGFIAKPFCKTNFEHYIDQWQQSRIRHGVVEAQ